MHCGKKENQIELLIWQFPPRGGKEFRVGNPRPRFSRQHWRFIDTQDAGCAPIDGHLAEEPFVATKIQDGLSD
jgi:hypothetical protein